MSLYNQKGPKKSLSNHGDELTIEEISNNMEKSDRSGQELTNKVSLLAQEIVDPSFKNNRATFNSLVEQLNRISLDSLRNIQSLRQDINYLEKNKFNLEQKHQQEFESKKKDLEDIILEQNRLNDSVEETIIKQQQLLKSLEENRNVFFKNYRQYKEHEHDDNFIDKLGFNDNLFSKYQLHESGLSGGNRKISKKKKLFKRKNILLGGMNSLFISGSEPLIQKEDLSRQIASSREGAKHFYNQLKEQNDEIKKQNQIISLFNKLIREGVQHEIRLIRQRKKLKYQVSDLIANSKNIVNEKLSNLKKLSEQGDKSSEIIRKKQKHIIQKKMMISKIKDYISSIFQTLIPVKATDEKKMDRLIKTYNKLKMTTKDNIFQLSLDQHLPSLIMGNLNNFSKIDLEELLKKINSPNEHILKEAFKYHQMSGGGKSFRKERNMILRKSHRSKKKKSSVK